MINRYLLDNVTVARNDVSELLALCSISNLEQPRPLIEAKQDLATASYSLQNKLTGVALEKLELAQTKVINSISSLCSQGINLDETVISNINAIIKSVYSALTGEELVARGGKPFNEGHSILISDQGFSYNNHQFRQEEHQGLTNLQMLDTARNRYYLGDEVENVEPHIYAESPNLSDISLADSESIIIGLKQENPGLNVDIYIEQDTDVLSVSVFDSNKEEVANLDTGFVSASEDTPKTMVFNHGAFHLTKEGLALQPNKESFSVKVGGPNGHTINVDRSNDLVISISSEGRLIKEKTIYQEDRQSEFQAP